jgi:hypothetical protein
MGPGCLYSIHPSGDRPYPPPPPGGGGRYDASSFTVDFLLEEIATAFDCQSAQPIPINDYPPPAGGR